MVHRVIVLPHRNCSLLPMEFTAVAAELARRADLPDVPNGIDGDARRYWLDRAERRLVEKIAPAAVRCG